MVILDDIVQNIIMHAIFGKVQASKYCVIGSLGARLFFATVALGCSSPADYGEASNQA